MKLAYWRAIGAGLALSVAAQPVLAAAADRPVTILAKVGGSLEERRADDRRCDQIAADAPLDDLPSEGGGAMASALGRGGLSYGMPGYGTMEGAAGSAIAYAIIASIEISKARGRASVFCMSNLGYVPVPLTAEEAAAFRGLGGGRKRAWEEAFLAAPELAPRIEALRALAAPDLPGYRIEPATQGGLRFDIASMTTAAGPVGAQSVLASGSASRWRTAELLEDFRADVPNGVLNARAGTVFHQVDYRPQVTPLLRDQRATWCGEATETSRVGGTERIDVWCVTPQPGGYTVFRPSGYVWQAGLYQNGPAATGVTTPLRLREREADDLALTHEIRLLGVTGFNVTLEGSVRNGEERVVLWRQQITMRDGARLTLPLWTRRLHLSRADGLVTATLDDQGDGTGLRRQD